MISEQKPDLVMELAKKLGRCRGLLRAIRAELSNDYLMSCSDLEIYRERIDSALEETEVVG